MDKSSDITSSSKNENSQEAQFKICKIKTDTIKKENDDEQWISGEELYTDESSDEEGPKGIRRKHKREHKGARPKDKTQNELETPPKPALAAPLVFDNEPPIDISWKPKRGSIKLPHMIKDLELNTSSTSKDPADSIPE